MNHKIKIGILAESKEEAIEFCKDITKQNDGYNNSTNNSVILETPFCVFIRLPKENSCGSRVNYIYAKKEDVGTEYFKTVILPMCFCGIGIINKGE